MWKPSEDQEQYLKLVLSMTTDCLLGKGVDTVNTYINNIVGICNDIPQPENTVDAVKLCRFFKCELVGKCDGPCSFITEPHH